MIVKELLSNFRLQGKSSKEVKEAFISLRASFQYVTKQLEESRLSRSELNSLNSQLNKEVDRLKKRVEVLENSTKQKVAQAKSSLKEDKSELSSTVTRLTNRINRLQATLSNVRSRSIYHQKVKYSKNVIIKDLRQTIKDLNKDIKKLSRNLEREKEKQKPKTKYVTRIKKEYETKIVKEPLPDKLRQLMLDGGITRAKLDYIAIAATLLRFSDRTKLTLRQCLMLLEISNYQYFKHEFLINKSPFTLKELESKGLIQGDRAYSKRAVGWYITEKGKKVANLLYRRLYEHQKIKKEFIRNED